MDSESRTCSICGSMATGEFDLMVQQQHRAVYFRCSNCQFLFISNPHWLEGSFVEKLNKFDLGTVDRCIVVADFIEGVICSERIKLGRFLDWGGGYGLFTRIARDRGLNFESYDPFAEPLFAGLSIGDPTKKYDLISISEVLLHLTNPLEIIRDLLASSGTVVVTAVVPPSIVKKDWWYLMPVTGEHVAFYSVQTLNEIARLLDVSLTTDSRFFHVFHRRKLRFHTRVLIRSRPLAFGSALLRHNLRFVARVLGRSKTLTLKDQEELISQYCRPR